MKQKNTEKHKNNKILKNTEKKVRSNGPSTQLYK